MHTHIHKPSVRERRRQIDLSTHSFKSPMYHQSFCGSVYTLGQTVFAAFLRMFCCWVSFRLFTHSFRFVFCSSFFYAWYYEFLIFFRSFTCYINCVRSDSIVWISNTIGGAWLCIFKKKCTNRVQRSQFIILTFGYKWGVRGRAKQPIYNQDPETYEKPYIIRITWNLPPHNNMEFSIILFLARFWCSPLQKQK